MRAGRSSLINVVLSLGMLSSQAVSLVGAEADVHMYVVERIGTAPRPMAGTLVIAANAPTATVVVIGVATDGGRSAVRRVMRVESSGLTFESAVYGPMVTRPVSSCDTGVACPTIGALRRPDAPLRISSDEAATTLRFYIAYTRAEVSIDPGPGWGMRRVTGGRLVVLDNQAAGGSGAKFGRLSFERFLGASFRTTAPGVAFAAIPCPPDPYLLGRPGGSGQAVLSGGDPDRGSQVMRCVDRTWFSYAIASGRTRFELRGEAVGYTSQFVRLAVVVLPPPRN